MDDAAPGPSGDAFHVRRFRYVNRTGLQTLYIREVRRFTKVISQTVIAPVISTLLLLIVFTQAFGERRIDIEGVPFTVFLVPGLIMMSVITNAFANSSSSLLIAKVQGSIVDLLVTPLSPGELVAAIVAGAVTRGILVGTVTTLTCAAFMVFNGTPLEPAAFPAIIYFSMIAACLFATLGLIGGIWADKFDDLAAVTNFIITPLTFLSGTFYAVSSLPPAFQVISYCNPVFYLVDGFRSGFTGSRESALAAGIPVTAGLTLFLLWAAYSMIKSGYKIRE